MATARFCLRSVSFQRVAHTRQGARVRFARASPGPFASLRAAASRPAHAPSRLRAPLRRDGSEKQNPTPQGKAMSNAKNQPSSPTHTAAFLRTSETHQEAKELGAELKKRGPHRHRKHPAPIPGHRAAGRGQRATAGLRPDPWGRPSMAFLTKEAVGTVRRTVDQVYKIQTPLTAYRKRLTDSFKMLTVNVYKGKINSVATKERAIHELEITVISRR